ncbi:uncharacterized protein LODBEIA_P28710 [Lodderomyces beijingensis]|uniref:Uncharacterized protein n=1 Tax=Lodderomyces beijingensis TaxID=1775926 RepID=A0ABP0ZMR3_9ASCO
MSNIHAASTTLDDIINELKLTYDSSVGVLDGESIRKVPNINTLTNLNKLLKNLYKQLSDVEQVDDEVLAKVDTVKSGKRKGGQAKESHRKRHISAISDAAEDDDKSKLGDLKRRRTVSIELESEQEDDTEANDTANFKGSPAPSQQQQQQQHQQQRQQQPHPPSPPVPPVQTGSFTPEDDTRLKNPKSEYVEPQTLSADAIAALGLYSEENEGLETHGTDFLKKKYGVASYPASDLQHLLPGKIPDTDLSQNKPPANQVQFTTFQSYIESYFRPFSTDDVKFLKERNVVPPGFEKLGYEPDLTPFVIPKLGRFYADAWIEEDASLASKLNSPAQYLNHPDCYSAKGSINSITDDNLYTEDVSCGPLSSRLLSAILSNHEGEGAEHPTTTTATQETGEEKIVEINDENSSNRELTHLAEDEVATQLNSSEDYKLATEPSDYQSIEDRLKRELKYIGIFMNLPFVVDDKNKSKSQMAGRLAKRSTHSIVDNDEWIKNREDDEVCAEIRSLQKELREVTSRNRANKKKLIPIMEESIAYQEYCTILDELDKQVDQAYMKRSRGRGKKKKIDATTPQQQAVNSGLRTLLEKRKRWIDNIGALFPPPEIMKRVPAESIMIKEGEVEAEAIEVEDNDNGPSAAVSKLI